MSGLKCRSKIPLNTKKGKGEGGGIDYAHHITTGPSRFFDGYHDKFSVTKKKEFPNKKKKFTHCFSK